MKYKNELGHTRALLADVTQDIHTALHVHPLLARLLKRDLQQRELRAVLKLNLQFVATVEAVVAPHASLKGFRLNAERAALCDDLGCDPVQVGAAPRQMQDEAAALGVLYVAHGAQFGRQQIARTMRRHDPSRASKYFDMPSDPRVWQALTAALDALSERQVAQAKQGALYAFETFKSLADAALRDSAPALMQVQQNLEVE